MTERGVRDSLRHERDDGQEAAGFQIDSAAVPVFAEQDIVVIMCEIGGEIAERVPACGSVLVDPFTAFLDYDSIGSRIGGMISIALDNRTQRLLRSDEALLMWRS